MAQTQVFRGVQSNVTRDNKHIAGFYRGTMVCHVLNVPHSNAALVTLNTAGWFTNTTKIRMNQFAAQFCNHQYGVYQKKGEWFVSINGVPNPVPFNGNTVRFSIDADKVDFAKEEN